MRKFFFKIWDVHGGAVLPASAVISAFFLCGAVVGCAAASYMSADALAQSLSPLAAYIAPDTSGAQPLSVLSVFFNTYKYPAAAFLLGFTALGVFLVPSLTALRGFFLSFAVTSVARLFGGNGILLNISIFGLVNVLSLPCLIVLASQSLISSFAMASMISGRGGRPFPVFPKGYFIRAAVCVPVLAVSAMTELYLAPGIVSMILSNAR